MHQPSSDVAPGHVIATMRTGYSLHDKVVRPAQVTVAKVEDTKS